MTRPVNLFGAVRLHVFGPDTTTSLGYLSGADSSGTHSKEFSESALSFTASVLEELLDDDETSLEGAFVVAEVRYDSDWLAIGTPYMLSPGSGQVIGDGARNHTPVAASALAALLEECIVFPSECDTDSSTFKHAGGIEQNRYMDFTSKHYSESTHTWHDAAVYDPTGHKKEGKPKHWADADAEWVFRDADEGGRTCFRFGTFTLTDPQRVVIQACADENAKVFLDGPNQGGCVIDWTADEDGYNQGFGEWKGRLAAGTYRVSGWMLSIDSEGGDGNDSMRLTSWSVLSDGSGDRDDWLVRSDADTRVLRQAVDDEVPGMTPGETMRRLLIEASDQGCEAADLLIANRTFTDTIDSDGEDWTSNIGYVWPLRTSLSSAFSDMLTDIDVDMGPEFTFDAWQDRGSDLSASVALTPGADPPTAAMNILNYTYDSEPAGPNALVTESQEGLGVYAPTVPSGERRRWGSEDSGASGTAGRAKANARKAIKANGSARRHYDAEFIAVTGAVPWVHFTLCDVINGRGYRNLGLDLEATSLSWKQGESVTCSATLTTPAP